MEFHMINIIYAALPICAQTEKTTFSCKDNCKQTKHIWCWTYSTLPYFVFFEAPCMVLYALPKHIPACRSVFNQPDEFWRSFRSQKKKIMRTKHSKLSVFYLLYLLAVKVATNFTLVAGVQHKLPFPHKVLLVLSPSAIMFLGTGSMPRIISHTSLQGILLVLFIVWKLCGKVREKEILGGIAKLSAAGWL